VRRIGKQGKTIRQYPADDFNDEVDKGKRKSHPQATAILGGSRNVFHGSFYDEVLPVRM
jgi:hypothetical protein